MTITPDVNADIAIDIDSTLYDFETPFRQAFFDLAIENGDKEKYFQGFYHSWVEWRSPADVCGPGAFEEALARVHSPRVIRTRTPFEDSASIVRELDRKGYKLLYITNRDPNTFDATEEWLYENDFPQAAGLICTFEDKSYYLRNCQYLIDDRPKTLCDFVYESERKPSFERKAFGMLYEYNRGLTDIDNIYLAHTWRGIHYYLEEKGVLDGRRSASLA